MSSSGPASFRFGPDLVERDGDDRIVHARHAMAEWQPSRFRRALVELHGERCYVAAAAPTGDGGCLYRP